MATAFITMLVPLSQVFQVCPDTAVVVEVEVAEVQVDVAAEVEVGQRWKWRWQRWQRRWWWPLIWGIS
jgi:hypothetical protein